MKHQKKSLRFKKIKIANMNFIKGGGDEDPAISDTILCLSQNQQADCAPIPASDIDNPCSDGCMVFFSYNRELSCTLPIIGS